MTEDIEVDEPIRSVVVRWRCPFCGRSHSARTRTREHMARCWFNPAARSCKTCVHFRENWGNGEGCGRGLNVNVPTDRPGVFKLPTGCPLWELDPEAAAS